MRKPFVPVAHRSVSSGEVTVLVRFSRWLNHRSSQTVSVHVEHLVQLPGGRLMVDTNAPVYKEGYASDMFVLLHKTKSGVVAEELAPGMIRAVRKTEPPAGFVPVRVERLY